MNDEFVKHKICWEINHGDFKNHHDLNA